MTQEFHISVTPIGLDQYLVRTEEVPRGVQLAEEQVQWNVEGWLTQAQQLLNHPLVDLLQDKSPAGLPHAAEPVNLAQLGRELYNALFEGTLRDSWITAQGIAQNRGEALHLRLGLKGPRLPRLPWEILQSSAIAHPVATGNHILFSRYQPGSRLVGEPDSLACPPGQPLRILMVTATPTDQARLELQREVQQIQQELQTRMKQSDGSNAPDMLVTILDQPGREELTQILEQGKYQVLHYAGHSDLGTAGGSLYLVNRRTGLTEILSGDDLAGLLANNGIRMTVFNSCRGSYSANADPSQRDRNLAQALVTRGIPAVLAMAEQIPDNVALTLTWLFYRNLKQGYPIDLSLSRARQGLLSAYGSSQAYWALPILYLHPGFDGYLMASDRDRNPADRLVRMPLGQFPGAPPGITDDDMATLPEPELSEDDEAMVFDSVVADDDINSFDDYELDYPQEGDEEDVAIVKALLEQTIPTLPPRDPQLTPENPFLDELPATNTGLFEPPQSTNPRSAPAITPPIAAATPTPSEIPRATTLPPAPPPSPSPSPLPPLSPPPPPPSSPLPTPSSPSLTQAITTRLGFLLPLIAALGAMGIVFGLWLQYRNQPGNLFNPTPVTTPAPAEDLSKLTNPELLQRASQPLTPQTGSRIAKAIALLMDRGDLNAAATILNQIPDAQLSETAELIYLEGRLHWQNVQLGNPDYSLETARLSWESATRLAPENAQYEKAIGFLSYAEGDAEGALRAWSQALTRLPGGGSMEGQAATPEALDLQAGIAIALNQMATANPEQAAELQRKSNDTYRQVMETDGQSFTPEALAKNWLWTEGAIADWQTLGQVQ